MKNTTLGLFEAINQAWRLRKVVLGIYIIQFLLALIIGIQVFEVFEASIGSSLIMNELMQEFSCAILMDFLNVHGASLSPLLGLLRWVLLLYLLVSSFVHAGLLSKIVDDQSSFWIGASRHFLGCFVLGLIALVSFLLFSVICWLPLMVNLFSLIEVLPSERPIVWAIIVLIVVWIGLSSLLYTWSVKARYIYILHSPISLLKTIRMTNKSLFSQWFSLILLFLFLAFCYFSAYGFVFWLEMTVGIKSIALTIFFFVIHQLVVIFKIFLGVIAFIAVWQKIRNQFTLA